MSLIPRQGFFVTSFLLPQASLAKVTQQCAGLVVDLLSER
jgi:hypothetical protein